MNSKGLDLRRARTACLKTGIASLIVVALMLTAGTAQAKLVACVGDSITYGYGIANASVDSYPAQLERMLQRFDTQWRATNFGVSGATLLRRGDKPYHGLSAYQMALNSEPDVVVIMLGTNDTKSQNWAYKEDFVADYTRLIDSFATLPKVPEIWICKPVPVFSDNFGIRESVLTEELIPLIDQIAEQTGVNMIDMHTAMEGVGDLYADGVHPNAEGAGLIAERVAAVLTEARIPPDFNNDGIVNLVDFARLTQHNLLGRSSLPSLDSNDVNDPNGFNPTPDLAVYDISPAPNADGRVDLKDMAGLFMHWLSTPGLIAHWRLDESNGTATYDSVTGREATVLGDAMWSSEGKSGDALLLDGVNDYIKTDDTILNPADGSFSVFVWAKGSYAGGTLISQTDSGGKGRIWLGTTPGDGDLFTDLTNGGRFTTRLTSDHCVTDNEWHHIGLVWDGTYRLLTVDNVTVAIDERPLSRLEASRGRLHIGAGKTPDPANLWFGLIDDLIIYNKPVTPQL